MPRLSRRWLGLGAAASGALLVLYALLSAPTDEERIVEQLATLEALLSYDQPPNPMHRTARLTGGFNDLMTAEVRVEVPERGFKAQGRRELARLAAGATGRMQSFRVVFSNLAISIHDSSATVDLQVDVEAEIGSELRRDTRDAALVFANVEGDWLLARALVSDPTED